MSHAKLMPFPEEDQLKRLAAQPPAAPTPGCSLAASQYYDMAQRIIAEAVERWISPEGVYRDPYEQSDRWQGGCSARFVCPAAILIARCGRTDLLPLTTLLMDRLCEQIAAAAGTGASPFPPGVVDLVAKELLITCDELSGKVAPGVESRWREALAGMDPTTCYTGPAKIAARARLTNYEIYAATAEWLKVRMGLTEDRTWLETFLAESLPLFSEYGMYRDPGDPALYDLAARHNVAELLHYGYDGPLKETLSELLRRAGLCTLLMVSPIGYAPFGGRSNWFIHNEAMVAYICEFEAIRHARSGNPPLAARFRGTAWRAIEVIRPFLEGFDPPHNLKNAFAPESKHGRDSSYGEYAIYSLLTASLLARTAIMVDDTLPLSPQPLGDAGAFLTLYPAFHRLFASCGNTSVQMELNAQEQYDATGVGRIHMQGVPSALGLSAPIAAQPKYIVGPYRAESGLAFTPCWETTAGSWVSLADQGPVLTDVSWQCRHRAADRVAWETCHSVGGDHPVEVRQAFDLQPGILSITASVSGAEGGIGFDAPCLHSDGLQDARISCTNQGAEVHYKGARLALTATPAEQVNLDHTLVANREALYKRLRITTDSKRIELRISLTPPDRAARDSEGE